MCLISLIPSMKHCVPPEANKESSSLLLCILASFWNHMNPVRFAILAVVTVNVTEDYSFWNVTPCNLVDICQCLEEPVASVNRVDWGSRFV